MPPPTQGFELGFAVIVIGAGGTGLCAALAAADAGAEVLVLERDSTPLGSTAMSTGLIPAAGTPEQAARGIADTPERFRDDMLRKTKGRTDPEFALLLASESAETIRWLRDDHGVPLSLMDGWLYPGHSAKRMFGTPNRTGGELMAALESALPGSIPVLTNAMVDRIYARGDCILGVSLLRPDGEREDIGCKAVVLACSGFGGNADLVARYIPEMAGAVYHGHPGNSGDALEWGEALGAEIADIHAYQGHGGLAAGHGVPILWPTITEGGFQANLDGVRFSDESAGYSEQAALVNAQPRQLAWTIYDARCHRLMLDFDDYRDALRAGAVIEASDEAELVARTGLPAAEFTQTLAEVRAATQGAATDRFGRDFTGKPVLAAPYYAAKVTGALFHTQGGLAVDATARVRKRDGGVFPNLFAGGGAARGVSGDGCAGYLAGNGLLAATTLGRLAGHFAALMAGAYSAAEPAPELRRHFVAAAGLRFNVIEAGSGPALLLLHGGGSRAAHFAELMPYLAGHFRVIAYDQRGFAGTGAAPDQPVDHAHWASDVIAMMDVLGIAGGRLFGWSMGATVAINAAARYPDRIAGIMLAGGPDPDRAVDVAGLEARLRAREVMSPGEAAIQDRAQLANMVAPGSRQRAGLLNVLVADRAASGIDLQRRAIEAYATRPPLDAALAQITCPAHVVAGAADPMFTADVAERLGRKLPAPTFDLLADCGHYYAAEQPQELARVMIERLLPKEI